MSEYLIPRECEGRRLLRHHRRAVFARSPTTIHSCFHGGASLINLSTGAYYRLEGMGFEIWKILDRPSTIKEIAAHLVADAAMESTIEDTTLTEFVDSLRHAGLLVVI